MQKSGFMSAVLAFGLWGVFPVYWKMLESVPADEILAHRIFWSFVSMVILLYVLGIKERVRKELGVFRENKQVFLFVAVGSVLVSINWFTYIWAVNDGRVLETSLGYYINPLVSVLIGIVFLGEKLTLWQVLSVILAFLGVLNMAISFGSMPWVAITLALSMGFYGFCKKKAALGAFSSMTVETFLIAPFALVYLLYTHTGTSWIPEINLVNVLLVSAGFVTVVPLLLFTIAATRLPLSILGLVQYLTPTMSFLLGVFLYREEFTGTHMISFALIWTALIIFTLSNFGLLPGKEKRGETCAKNK